MQGHAAAVDSLFASLAAALIVIVCFATVLIIVQRCAILQLNLTLTAWSARFEAHCAELLCSTCNHTATSDLAVCTR